jgi:hypothetical protein
MAAFQRGIGLAEARQMETSDWDAPDWDASALSPAAPDRAFPQVRSHLDAGLMDPPSRIGTSHPDALHMELAHMDAPHKDAAQPLGGPTGGAAPSAVPPSNLDAAHDRTSRQDGSTPAG